MNVRTVKVIEVIEVVSLCGKGTSENPFREITEYWSKEGQLLASVDDFEQRTNLTNEQ